MIKFDVLNKFTGDVQFTAKIDCQKDTNNSIKLGLAVKWAIENKADLRGADLREADLRGADLRGADLRWANLYGANLREADLYGADLRGADLYGADLYGANLREADLRGANLRKADLCEADLRKADLYGADLRSFKHDIWGVLAYAKEEVPNLLVAIQDGRIDGSVYEGECCCLCGTLEKGIGHKLDIRNAASPAEQWFSMIKKGDKPADNYASEMAEKWVKEWMELIG